MFSDRKMKTYKLCFSFQIFENILRIFLVCYIIMFIIIIVKFYFKIEKNYKINYL